MENASNDQAPTNLPDDLTEESLLQIFLDELTETVRYALRWVWAGRSLEDLRGNFTIPEGELESVMAGTGRVSPATALIVSYEIDCYTQDIRMWAQGAIDEAFANLPPTVKRTAIEEVWGPQAP